MAEERNDLTPEVGGEQEQDVLFQIQMYVANAFYGHWKKLVGVSIVFLIGVLIVGQVQDSQRNAQRGLSAEIADIERKMPESDPLIEMGLSAATEGRLSAYREGASQYESVATAGVGTGAVIAWSRAADAWILAGDNQKAHDALASALALEPTGILAWSVVSSLASLKVELGDVDGAVVTYEAYGNAAEGLLSQQALLNLSLVYEAAGQAEQSAETLQKIPLDSPLAIQVDEIFQRVRSEG